MKKQTRNLVLLGLAWYFFVHKKSGGSTASVNPSAPTSFASADDINKAINPFA